MPRGKTKDRDGIYQRKDRPGFWASWVDASGKRRQPKLEAYTLQQARALLSAEKARVKKTVTLGYAPPSAEKFLAVSERFLKHRRARLTPRSYEREKGLMEAHLRPFFGAARLAEVRGTDAAEIHYSPQRRISQTSASTTYGTQRPVGCG